MNTRDRSPTSVGPGARLFRHIRPRSYADWTLPFEQAVYGSFAFWDAGYNVLARSPGCRDEWLNELRAACQAVGEPPSGAAEAPGLLVLRLPSGIWAIVGMSPQGRDDRGRPGALAFHALFVDAATYLRAGANPFTFAVALRSEWTAADDALPSGRLPSPPSDQDAAGDEEPADPRTERIAKALGLGRRVLLESTVPIDSLARQVWRRLPPSVRARKSLATWAFGNGPRFDLVAVPRLNGIILDDSYVAAEPTEPLAATEESSRVTRLSVLDWRGFVVAALVATTGILGAAGVGHALRLAEHRGSVHVAPLPTPATTSTSDSAPPSTTPPRREAFPEDTGDNDPAERRRLAERLVDLCDRCGMTIDADDADDPTVLMERLAARLRYEGPLLGDQERKALAAEPHGDAELALEWDRLVRRFVPDRTLPLDFREGPPRWQLGVLAWTWRIEPGDAGRSMSEQARELVESLSVGVSLRPSLLARRYPALTDYLAFLGGLPRR